MLPYNEMMVNNRPRDPWPAGDPDVFREAREGGGLWRSEVRQLKDGEYVGEALTFVHSLMWVTRVAPLRCTSHTRTCRVRTGSRSTLRLSRVRCFASQPSRSTLRLGWGALRNSLQVPSEFNHDNI